MGRFVFEEVNGMLVGSTDDQVLNRNLRYGFSTRIGGVSGGSLSSLNLGVNRPDTPENLRRNYEFFCGCLGIDPEKVFVAKQIHSDIIMVVSGGEKGTVFDEERRPRCDGFVTGEASVSLGVFYADCTPVLLFDSEKKALAVVHCGWRGTVKAFAGKGVRTLAEQFGSRPENVHGVIGPCIGEDCFEVGSEVAEEFVAAGFENFVKKGKVSDKYYVDLKGVNRAVLLEAGLLEENITVSDECTHCLTEKYFSHRGCGADTGRMALIAEIKQES